MADALNRLFQNLVLKCAKSEGIRDYFYVGAIVYGGRVASGFGGALAGQHLVPVSTLANSPLRVEPRTRKIDDGARGILEQKFKFPVWFEAKPGGRTPMCQALTTAKQFLEVFVQRFPNCFPPLVVNITDGMLIKGIHMQLSNDERNLARQRSSGLDWLAIAGHDGRSADALRKSAPRESSASRERRRLA